MYFFLSQKFLIISCSVHAVFEVPIFDMLKNFLGGKLSVMSTNHTKIANCERSASSMLSSAKRVKFAEVIKSCLNFSLIKLLSILMYSSTIKWEVYVYVCLTKVIVTVYVIRFPLQSSA